MIQMQSLLQDVAPSVSTFSAEKKRPAADDKGKTIREKEKQNEDYWDRITDDAASGYKDEGNEDPLLNSDQQPGDNEKGDENP